MTPEAAYHHINSSEKCLVHDFKKKHLVNSEVMEMPVRELRFVDLSPRGIYMFFDADGKATYIGQTNQSF